MSTGLRAFGDLRLSYDMRASAAPVHGKVMKADASEDLAYAEFDFADTNEVWLTFDLAFDSAARAFWGSNDSNDFGDIANSGGAPDANVNFLNQDPDPPKWQIVYPAQNLNDTPTPTAATWYTLELHYAPDASTTLYVDSVLTCQTGAGFFENVGMILVGQYNGEAFDPAAICYIDNVKVGSARGGTDIFQDDFEDGTLNAWSSTSGAVSVVDDPFA